MTDTSGGFRAARGCAPVPPDAELPAAIIRRLRDGIGEDILDMTTDAGDATWVAELERLLGGLDEALELFDGESFDPMDVAQSAIIMHLLKGTDRIIAQSRQLAAYQAVMGVLDRQGLVFVNQGGYVECLMCGAVKHGEAIRHMPDCAAEALRALVAEEGAP